MAGKRHRATPAEARCTRVRYKDPPQPQGGEVCSTLEPQLSEMTRRATHNTVSSDRDSSDTEEEIRLQQELEVLKHMNRILELCKEKA